MKVRSERFIIWILFCVQFVNVLDFVMVMPLGPDFAKALGIPLSELGFVGGVYTFSAFLSGVAGSFLLDRFDRKKALVFVLVGLTISTLIAALATGFHSLLAARFMAGFFGGPATSLALAIVSDIIPAERRGRSLGVVMSSFAVASIIGIPLGLEMARLGGWQLPFLAVGALSGLVTALVFFVLPGMKAHLNTPDQNKESFYKELYQKKYFLSFALMSSSVFATFLVVPNLAGYLQANLKWPRENMGFLYLFGGLLSLVSSRFGGILADRKGTLKPVIWATLLGTFPVVFGLIHYFPVVPVLAIFPLYMFANSLRFVALNSLVSKVPRPQMRARFMSIQSAIQHLMSSAGAFVSAALLTSDQEGRLVGMGLIGVIVLILYWMGPGFVWLLDLELNKQKSAPVTSR